MTMNLISVIGSVTTVLSVLAFAGVVWWALGSARRARFDAAAQAPFALPDDLVGAPPEPKVRP
jgi:cytochrome c oxidase cbb3-type subunit 4